MPFLVESNLKTSNLKTSNHLKVPKSKKTLKQQRLLKEIDNAIKTNSKDTLRDLGFKAGYSKKSRTVYRPYVKKHILAHLQTLGADIEGVRKAFELSRELAIKSKDLTNFNRANEDLARMAGGFIDKSEVKAEITEMQRQSLLDLGKRLSVSSDN